MAAGTMKGSLNQNVLGAVRSEHLVEGAVLVLRQVSVFSPSPRKHYLNITARNLVTLFLPDATQVPLGAGAIDAAVSSDAVNGGSSSPRRAGQVDQGTAQLQLPTTPRATSSVTSAAGSEHDESRKGVAVTAPDQHDSTQQRRQEVDDKPSSSKQSMAESLGIEEGWSDKRCWWWGGGG